MTFQTSEHARISRVAQGNEYYQATTLPDGYHKPQRHNAKAKKETLNKIFFTCTICHITI